MDKFKDGNKRYPFKSTRTARSWTIHVRRAFNAYSRFLGNRRRKVEYKKYARKVKRGKTKLNLRQTKNNFFSTLYTAARRVLWTLSCGTIGLGGPRRSTPFGAQQLGRFTLKEIIRSKAYRAYLILKSSYTTHMRGCLANLGRRPKFRAILDLIPRPHNGLKAAKLRRI